MVDHARYLYVSRLSSQKVAIMVSPPRSLADTTGRGTAVQVQPRIIYSGFIYVIKMTLKNTESGLAMMQPASFSFPTDIPISAKGDIWEVRMSVLDLRLLRMRGRLRRSRKNQGRSLQVGSCSSYPHALNLSPAYDDV